MTTSLKPGEINLADPTPFEMGEAHELFRVLRREAPVHFNPGGKAEENDLMEFKPFWNVTRYADVIEISRNPERWSSARGITQFEATYIAPEDQMFNTDGKMLITMDPPRHVRLRRFGRRHRFGRHTRLHGRVHRRRRLRLRIGRVLRRGLLPRQ